MTQRPSDQRPFGLFSQALHAGRRRSRLVWSLRLLATALLITGTAAWRHYAAADTASIFTQATTVSSPAVASGSSITITTAVKATTAGLFSTIIDIEVYNAANQKVGQQYLAGVAISATQTGSLSYNWTAQAAGTYRVAVGVFGAGWTPMYLWANSAASITVTAPTFSQNTSAQAGSGNANSISSTITDMSGSLQNGIVDLEVYDANNQRLGQQYFAGQTMSAGQSLPFTWTWAAPGPGTYHLAVGIFGAGWSPSYYWAGSASSFTDLAATPTATVVPPSATSTATQPPSSTPTAVPPTNTNTPVPPTHTQTITNTPVPPTSTRTLVPPSSTGTPVPPTNTGTPIPPSATRTTTDTPVPPTGTRTSTNTPVPPTSTRTPLPPTSTGTMVPPTSTSTPLPPSATGTSTTTPVPPSSTSTRTPIPPSATSTATPASGRVLGYTATAGGQFDTGNNNNLSAVRVTTGTGGANVRSLSAYVGAIDTSNPAYGLALYTDSGGSPYALVASASGNLSGSGWNTLPVTAILAANTTYWLVYNAATGNSNMDEVYYVNGPANMGGWSPPVTCCAFPATQSGWTTASMQYAMYATLGSPGATATTTPTSVPGSATSTPVPATATRTQTPVPSATPSGNLVFDDEFNSPSLDTTTWTALNRPGDSSNSEQQCYKPSNASIVNSALVLTDKSDTSCSGYSYTSAAVQTKSFNFTYGTFEVRAQMPHGQGQWPALWLLGANCQATFPTSPDNTGACQWPTTGSDEIDMFEGKGNVPSDGFFNLNKGTSPNSDNLWFGCNGLGLPFDTSAAYHTYDLIWQPGSITWQIDGQTYCSTTANVPSTPMFIILNIAMGGSFTGPTIDTSVLPQTMRMDYVRVYQ